MREIWALDRATGAVQWQVGVPAPSGRKYSHNTYATPTPVTNGVVVVADFGPTMVAAGMSGEVVWIRDEPLYTRYLRYGAVRSPVIHGETVIRLYAPENPGVEGGITGEVSYLAAFDLATGGEVWRVNGIEGGHDAYSSPLLVPMSEGVAVVVAVNGYTHGYDAANGEHLWSFRAAMAHPVPSHVADDRAVYVGGGLYGPHLAAAIELGPFAPGAEGPPGGRSGPVMLSGRWKTNRQTPDIGSLLVYEGLVYWITSDGRMFCHDAQTGELVWRERLSGVFEPSPVAGDGRIYVQATDGRTIVLAAGRMFRRLAVNELFEFGSSHASIAIAGKSLFLRGRNHVFAVGPDAERQEGDDGATSFEDPAGTRQRDWSRPRGGAGGACARQGSLAWGGWGGDRGRWAGQVAGFGCRVHGASSSDGGLGARDGLQARRGIARRVGEGRWQLFADRDVVAFRAIVRRLRGACKRSGRCGRSLLGRWTLLRLRDVRNLFDVLEVCDAENMGLAWPMAGGFGSAHIDGWSGADVVRRNGGAGG